ncbi:MAG: zinc-ribbon domain-containing protein, partial [Desulfobacterales bacterium]|nr:zinc-ribbon domain-containing protein [Desulfobacterales bacterium]
MYCNKCGTENPDDGKFCSKCGNQLERIGSRISTDNKKNIDQKNKITLGLILGWIFGVLFLLSGLVFVADAEFLAGIPLVLSSLILIPPITEWLENKFN